MTQKSKNRLYVGDVWHKRTNIKKHAFKYPIYYVMVDLDDLHQSRDLPSLLGANRFNLFSIYERDYGVFEGDTEKSLPLKKRLLQSLRNEGLDDANYRITMLTMPRVLGYAFNPLTTFYVYNKDDDLVALLYEVHNTFGEKHTYVCQLPNIVKKDQTIPLHQAPKKFHVSPFYQVDGYYLFKQIIPQENLHLSIRYKGPNQQQRLTACLTAKEKSLNNNTLLAVFFKIPLQTIKVVLAIHYEAFKLWLKKIPFFTKPKPPKKPYTLYK